MTEHLLRSVAPAFTRGDVGSRASRRLLLVSYHFPPDRAVGARRWEKLVHTATERGYDVDVIMREHPMSDADASRIDALPAGVRVYQVPIPTLVLDRAEQRVADAMRAGRNTVRSVRAERPGEPSVDRATSRDTRAGANVGTSVGTTASATPSNATAPVAQSFLVESLACDEIRWNLTRPRGWLRMYWGWLDFKRGAAWGDDVVRTAVNLRRSTGRYAAVISSGPPHMSHDTGRRVAEAIGAPFVMDMRDPWSCAERLGESVASPYWLAMAGRYERRAVERAMLVVANTDVARDALRAKYPARRNDIITVMNGADDDPLPPPVHAKRFSIAHAGTIYLDRDPRPLFRAAARVIAEFGLTPEQFGLDFIGDFSGANSYPVQAVAREEGIEQYVTVGPSLPYAKAMEFMAGATMLVTMSGGSIAAIPAKTFECVRFEAWLLAMTAPESATARLLQGTGADVVSPADTEAMTAVLRQRYQQHAQGEHPPEIGRDGRFSRRRQAAILFDALDERMAVSKG